MSSRVNWPTLLPWLAVAAVWGLAVWLGVMAVAGQVALGRLGL